MRALYSLAWLVALPIVLIRLIWRSRAEPGYRKNLAERFSLYRSPPVGPVIWVHAVSLGETRAAAPLIKQLMVRNPSHRILLTQTTASGRKAARELFDDRVLTAWLPWDIRFFMRTFLRHFRPSIGVIMETELWPNMILACSEARVPLCIANARLSERSATRYRSLGAFFRSTLQHVTLIAAQSDADAARFLSLGARNVHVIGNIKFDAQPDEAQIALGLHWRQRLAGRKLALIASTRDGEELDLLKALDRALPPQAAIAIVPRHPQRFDEVWQLIVKSDLRGCRRSRHEEPDNKTRVWLGDSMGELTAWYSAASVAVIGGSWKPYGSQNPIEACAVGCPVVVGPHTFNFEHVTKDALAAGAAIRVENAAQMADVVAQLLADEERRARIAEAARQFAATYRGATLRCLDLIEQLIAHR
ncbi:lipid IV(A) 3-deoxy-D-manno-octulosonic acid transferase [Methyloversatilis discipulorum]|uniref:lipid IV(A) 3-deoxy-D-manno-octulosonic acid transferase n=1 Tax=Methyloversatilis discipulorum TaxID=1119528 RepID=UPI003AF9D79A